MKQVKRFGLYASQSLFRFFLALSIIYFAAAPLVSTSTTIKTVLRDTNTYTRFRDAIIAENAVDGGALSDPVLQDLAKKSFSESLLMNNTETAIDTTYSWLSSETAKPTIIFDFREAEATFLTGVREYALQRFIELPPCQFVNTTIDPLTADCIPANATADQINLAIDQGIASVDSFLPQTVITEDNIFPDSSGASLFEQFDNAPQFFRLIPYGFWVLPLLLLFLASCIVLIYKHRIVGLRSVGLSIVSVGAGLALVTFIFGIFLPAQTQQLGASLGNQPALQQLIQDISKTLLLLVQQNIITISIYVALGGLTILLASNLAPRQSIYKSIRLRSGLVSSNPHAPRKNMSKNEKYRANPIQSSEGVKRGRTKKKNAKARKIMKGLE